MKKSLLALSIFLALSSGFAAAQEPIIAQVVSAAHERIGLMKGDVVTVNAGKKDGVIKGDIGTIGMRADSPVSGPIGRCVVTKTFDSVSNCEIMRASKEIERGMAVLFQPVRFSDPILYPVIITTLQGIVDPYAPSRIVRVYIYTIFDDKGDVTAFSQALKEEINAIFSQKKRISSIDKRAIKEIAFYPEDYPNTTNRINEYQKKSDIDVVLWGEYRAQPDKVLLTLSWFDKNYTGGQQKFSLPPEARYVAGSQEVIIPYGQIQKVQDLNCTLVLKTMPVKVTKEEKSAMIRREAEGNPFVEQNLRAIDFSIVGAVETKVAIDGDIVNLAGKQEQTIILPRGKHRISASYKRGYFVQEALLYRSERELTRDILIDVTKAKDVTVEVRYAPLEEKEPIDFKVYRKADRELTVLRPIPRLDSDRAVDMFKD